MMSADGLVNELSWAVIPSYEDMPRTAALPERPTYQEEAHVRLVYPKRRVSWLLPVSVNARIGEEGEIEQIVERDLGVPVTHQQVERAPLINCSFRWRATVFIFGDSNCPVHGENPWRALTSIHRLLPTSISSYVCACPKPDVTICKDMVVRKETYPKASLKRPCRPAG